MNRHFLRILWVSLAAILLVSPAAWADTLELRNGRVIQGRYLGGSQNNIRFQVNGQVEYYPISDVLTLTFGPVAQTPAPGGRYGGRTPGATAPAAQSNSVTVPAGMRITVRMIDGVDSETNKPGDTFRASLDTDIVVDGVLAVPRSSDVRGRLVEVKEAGRIAGRSELRLELTDIMVNGQWQPVSTGDYDVTGKSRGADSAKKIGAGAAIGAVVGAIAGGGKGAAIGAGVGAGAGTAIQIFTKGDQVRVPSETTLEFALEKPLVVRQPATKARP
ncbi:MAG: hypothetical protein HY234_11860 [Acidobacteria bacterium]|nr:hypothetical protein [Acidobacteriota bacterium]MBI3663726.1 hypothetical protein [Acidobacteriota bacterium]